jgi:hypothetical protein
MMQKARLTKKSQKNDFPFGGLRHMSDIRMRPLIEMIRSLVFLSE